MLPYALKEILSALASDAPDEKNRAYYWAFVVFVTELSLAQANLFQNWHTQRCYERTKGQLFCIIHYKSLKRQEISGRVNAEGETSSADLGKTLNLMQSVFRDLNSKPVLIFFRGDSNAVAQRFWDFSGIFTAPVRIIIALVFLYQYVNVILWVLNFNCRSEFLDGVPYLELPWSLLTV